MAKTCRTCRQAVTKLRCTVHHQNVHPTEVYDCYKPRETPLLVDELGEALKTLLDENVLYEITQQANTFPNEPIMNLIENVAPKVLPALNRYQKEVGDVEV